LIECLGKVAAGTKSAQRLGVGDLRSRDAMGRRWLVNISKDSLALCNRDRKVLQLRLATMSFGDVTALTSVLLAAHTNAAGATNNATAAAVRTNNDEFVGFNMNFLLDCDETTAWHLDMLPKST
jgi:hypothetical protein